MPRPAVEWLMDLLVLPDGTIRAIYAEEIELDSLGHRRYHLGPAMSSSDERWLLARRPDPRRRARSSDRSDLRSEALEAELALAS